MAKQKTKEQALKENLIEFIVFEAIGVVALILGLIIDVLMIFGLIFAAAFIILGVYLFFRGKKIINRSYCLKCKTKYDYETNVSWEEVERIEKDTKIDSKVEFKCVCPNCGEIQTFSDTFTILSYDQKNNTWKEHNLESMVKKYFVK